MGRLHRWAGGIALWLMVFSACPARAQQTDSADTRFTGDSLYHKLYQRSKKDDLIGKGLKAVLRPVPLTNFGGDTTQPSQPQPQRKNSYQGRIIHHISIETLDPFGPQLTEVRKEPVNFLERTANAVHYTSRNWTIRQALLFKEGDTVNVLLLRESERLIRSTAAVHDARILLVPINDSSVDVIVRAQDIWSIGASIGYDFNTGAGNATLIDQNFLGLGHVADAGISMDTARLGGGTYTFRYFVPSIGRSYIQAEARAISLDLDQRQSVRFERPFLTTSFSTAGGISFERFDDWFGKGSLDDQQSDLRIESYTADAWFGKALIPDGLSKGEQGLTRVIPAIRYRWQTHVFPKEFNPEWEPNFQDDRILLMSMSYVTRNYRTDRYIFDFGRTEDIPVGHSLTLTLGFGPRDGRLRYYGGMRAAWGRVWNGNGFFYMNAELGGFSGAPPFSMGALTGQFLAYTPIKTLGRWKVRQYLWSRTTLGINRQSWEGFDINRQNGVRGLRIDNRGQSRTSLNYELDLFVPYNFFGFRMAWIVFADMALLAPAGRSLAASPLYGGYGVGIRLRNSYLVFPTLQFSLGYYPNAHNWGGNTISALSSRSQYFRFSDLGVGRPELVGY